MAARKDPISELPLTADQDTTQSATITYASDVVAIIAGLATVEVEGIAGMCSVSGSVLSKNRNVTKGVRVEMGTEEVAVDLYVAVDYGTPIHRAAMDAQESVRKAIESMTGLHVVRVDVHVQSMSFEKENKALAAGAESAALEAGRPELEQDDAGRKASAKKETPTASAAGMTTAEKEAEGDMESGTIPENEGEEDGRKAGGRDRGGRIRAKKDMKPEADDGPQEGVQSADSVTE